MVFSAAVLLISPSLPFQMESPRILWKTASPLRSCGWTVRNSNRRGTINALRLILPKGEPRHVAHRAAALAPDLSIELYERDPVRETLEKIALRHAGNQDTWLVPHRESASPPRSFALGA